MQLQNVGSSQTIRQGNSCILHMFLNSYQKDLVFGVWNMARLAFGSGFANGPELELSLLVD